MVPDIEAHLMTPRSKGGHGWKKMDVEAHAHRLQEMHVADHKALAHYAGHTHSSLEEKNKK